MGLMDKKAWLIRPKPSGVNRLQEFLDEQLIAVGWPGLGDLSGNREYEVKMKLRDRYADNASALSALKMIVYRMSPGDLVLIPYEKSIFFGEIVGEYTYDKKRDEMETGFPHQRKAEWFDLVLSREELPVELQKSTRVVRTAAELTKHLHLIERILKENHAVKRKVNKEQVVETKTSSFHIEKEELAIHAKQVVKQELNSDDPQIRLRAADIALRYFLE